MRLQRTVFYSMGVIASCSALRALVFPKDGAHNPPKSVFQSVASTIIVLRLVIAGTKDAIFADFEPPCWLVLRGMLIEGVPAALSTVFTVHVVLTHAGS